MRFGRVRSGGNPTGLRKDILHYLPSVVVPFVGGVLGTALHTRLFAPDAYGAYVVVSGLCMVAVAVGGQWLQQSILRYGHASLASIQERPRYLVGVAVLSIVAAVASIAILVPLLWSVGEPRGSQGPMIILTAVLSVVLELFFRVGLSIARAALKPAIYSNMMALYTLLKVTCLAVGGVLMHGSVLGLLVGLCVGQALSLLALVASQLSKLVSRREYAGLGSRLPLRPLFRKYVYYGAPMALWFISSQVMTLSDRYALARVLGVGAAGVYTPSYNLATQLIGLVASPLILALHPRLMRQFDQGAHERPKIAEALRRSTGAYLILGGLGVAAGAAVATPAVAVFAGAEYRGGAPLVPILLVGAFLWNLSLFTQKPLELAERTRFLAVALSATAVAGAVATYVAVLFWGMFGAAAAYVGSCLVYCLVPMLRGRRYLDWHFPTRTLLAVCICAAASSACGTLAVLSLPSDTSLGGNLIQIIVGGMAAVLVYAGLMLVTRTVRLGQTGGGVL